MLLCTFFTIMFEKALEKKKIAKYIKEDKKEKKNK